MADGEARWVMAMREALTLAQEPDAPLGENPRVGCVILDRDGAIVGRGHHRGAGTPHAEVVALAQAGDAARGGTAVVTLEPCRHVGRTGPCTAALVQAGVAAVVVGQQDPTDEAGGGARTLRGQGVEVTGGVLGPECERVNAAWTFAVRAGRPLVTWKVAASLDGRVAGPDGGPTSITGPAARAEVHVLRSDVGAIVVGTGTVLVDDPELTVRLAAQGAAIPLRVVVGSRPLPPDARVLDDQAPTLVIDSHDPVQVLADLFDRGIRHVLLEGGPTLAAAFLRAQLVDRVEWYLAPLLLGDGPVALADWATVGGAPVGVDVEDVAIVGEDVRVVGRVRYQQAGL
ncbi:MAG: bifunctional diaminohydroxyphosphoribosylaminopyrimidine deaminase/5-amino-6-(5-phosphoribosylamino)uracil reductase RibD [Actinobacteria bacterium]|nr:bifunctional diaminohydroxyphosphoribosylaminopyrimidine deaminase/5-amino-6-(5-phosphoribosylamino)uracil reductase RibD [Actinomycetota bacterium]